MTREDVKSVIIIVVVVLALSMRAIIPLWNEFHTSKEMNHINNVKNEVKIEDTIDKNNNKNQ